MSKQDKLKPRVIECHERLGKLMEINAPAVIIGAAAWHLFQTVLAVYGTSAGSTMIQDLRDKNLHSRGICSHEDCTNYVDRPNIGICKMCAATLGIPQDAEEVL